MSQATYRASVPLVARAMGARRRRLVRSERRSWYDPCRSPAPNHQDQSDSAVTRRGTMAQAGTLHDAFMDELRDTYDAEKQLIKALPKLAKAATSPELRAAFEAHLEETRGQVERLGGRVCQPRRKSEGQALRRHCRHHRGGQVDHGGGVRRRDDGRLPDRGRPARRALRDGGLRHAGRVGEDRWGTTTRLGSSSRTSRRKRPRTRSCRRWRRKASTRVRPTRRTRRTPRKRRTREPRRRRTLTAARVVVCAGARRDIEPLKRNDSGAGPVRGCSAAPAHAAVA